MLFLLNFAKSYWKPILIAVAALLLMGYIHLLKHQRNAAVDALQAYKIQVEVTAKVQEAKVAETITKQAEITTTTANAYNDSILRLRKYYDNQNTTVRGAAFTHGLRLPAISNSGEVSAISSPTERTHDSAQGDQPSAGTTTLDCAEDVLTLLKLQQWIKGQEGVN